MMYGRRQEEVECESRCVLQMTSLGGLAGKFQGDNKSRQITVMPLQGKKDRISQMKKVARG